MQVLVTGRDGQLARCLAERRPAGVDLQFAARPEHDLERPDGIARLIRDRRPDIVINAAGYTQVDQAEDDAATAMLVNGVAPGVIARAAAEAGAIVIQLSTDYVFDGTASRAWREDDPANPVSIYGQTKLAGERAVASSGCEFIVARVSWLFSEHGHNFVRTMLRLAGTRDAIGVVADQTGTPTYAGDLADALYRIARTVSRDRTRARQIVNVVNADTCSWADFAEAIFACSAAQGGPVARVERVTTGDFPTRAIRPANSVLDVSRLEALYAITMPSWRNSIAAVVAALLRQRQGESAGNASLSIQPMRPRGLA